MVVDLYQGALPAILPFLKDNLGLTYTLAGVVLIVANLTSSVIQPIFGLLSDKKEKAFLLPLGALLAGVGFSLLPLTGSYRVCAPGDDQRPRRCELSSRRNKDGPVFTGEKMVTGMSVFSVGGNRIALGPIIALSLVNYLAFHRSHGWCCGARVRDGHQIPLHRAIALPTPTRALRRPARRDVKGRLPRPLHDHLREYHEDMDPWA